MSDLPRILLIEEDGALAEEICGVLENSGYEVQTAADWPYALLLALGFEPDLVILDTALPNLSSSSATHILRTSPDYGPRFRRVPFLYITERKHILTQRFTYHPGLPTSEYVFKPVDPEILLQLVRRNLHAKENEN
jgi:CheY-like chemotaxis protein